MYVLSETRNVSSIVTIFPVTLGSSSLKTLYVASQLGREESTVHVVSENSAGIYVTSGGRANGCYCTEIFVLGLAGHDIFSLQGKKTRVANDYTYIE